MLYRRRSTNKKITKEKFKDAGSMELPTSLTQYETIEKAIKVSKRHKSVADADYRLNNKLSEIDSNKQIDDNELLSEMIQNGQMLLVMKCCCCYQL